ncbi:MAG: deoxyguanosinetriphosphate triphosphohydrolase, partial [Sphingomonadaceae bacterium]
RPESVDEVRQMEQALVDFSRGMSNEERTLKRFMYTRLYRHPRQIDISERAGLVISGLAEAYFTDPTLLPQHWRRTLPEQEPLRTRHIGDFIAGMTDRYALARYRELVGPIEMPDGF